MAPPSGSIVIDREHARRRDRLRKYTVLLDGDSAGAIQDGQSETFSVEPGSHSVRLKLDWTRSETVNVTVLEGSVVNLKCGPRGGSFTLLPDVLLRPGSYLRLEASD